MNYRRLGTFKISEWGTLTKANVTMNSVGKSRFWTCLSLVYAGLCPESQLAD